MEIIIMDNETSSILIGCSDQLISNTNLLAQISSPRFGRDESIWPSFHKHPVLLDSANDPTKALRSFKQLDAQWKISLPRFGNKLVASR
jgi:hypothetical protein